MGPASSAEISALMAMSVLRDHEYGPFTSFDSSESFPGPSTQTRETSPSASTHDPDSDLTQDEPKPAGKRKRKSLNLQDDVLGPRISGIEERMISVKIQLLV
ncbi:hypothetical protein NDU88_006751 [Pleurodeles waltl]|uniref:Uncharacterized protein n=1 Tax=Pleurodeles waltl TaxID=8319 RepID=A0AAV7TZ95_PLEWA|nr:hypothetical protein NDU88_006751 [Pleurodeles waltl]